MLPDSVPAGDVGLSDLLGLFDLDRDDLFDPELSDRCRDFDAWLFVRDQVDLDLDRELSDDDRDLVASAAVSISGFAFACGPAV